MSKRSKPTITKVSIQLNHSLICGGIAVFVQGHREECIFFDVVKSEPIKVVVGGRGRRAGKSGLSDKEADYYEDELLSLFLQHNLPLQLGTYSLTREGNKYDEKGLLTYESGI